MGRGLNDWNHLKQKKRQDMVSMTEKHLKHKEIWDTVSITENT